MAGFPSSPLLPIHAPVPIARPVSAPPAAVPAPTPKTTGEALTLDALMARQKDAAQRQQGTMQEGVTNIPQGLAQVAWTLVNALQQRKAEREYGQGQQEVASAFAQFDPETGQMPPEAMEQLLRRDPEAGMGLKIEMYKQAMQLRQEQAKTDAENAKAGVWKPSDIGSLRDDYTKAAATYTTADPSWNSMKQSAAIALNPDASVEGKGAADYDMIVGWAKLLDPQSVVREGEVQSASITGGMLGQLNGWLNTLRSQGSLDDATRRAIMTQAASRMSAYYNEAKTKRDWITGIATRHGVLPDDVVSPLPEFTPFEQKPEPDPNSPDPNNPQPPPAPEPAALPEIDPEDFAAYEALPPGTRYHKKGDPPEVIRMKPGRPATATTGAP